jgi:flavin-dependent dehydrogenase
MYDVIIIGAGPAGCSAAKKLADDGCKVLIVERFKMPRNKSCSGVLIKKSVDLVSSYFGEEIPKFVMCLPNDNRGMIFTNDEGREYRYEQPGLNIWRSSFDCWLATQAAAAGAELRDETSALSCEEQADGVIVKLKGKTEYSEKAKFVIACDGVTSVIKRKLICTPCNYITTYQTFCKGVVDLDYHYFYAYLQPEFSEYDAWFNVKDDYLIFGVSVKNTGKIEHYYSKFIEYMTREHNAEIEKQDRAEKWIMPYIVPGCPIDYGKGRVLFAGEAAGFLNPMGEGISSALESGYAAAKSISAADIPGNDIASKISDNDIAADILGNDIATKIPGNDIAAIHSEYRKNTLLTKTYMERQWHFVANISAKFNAHKG